MVEACQSFTNDFLFPAPRDGCLQTEVPALNAKQQPAFAVRERRPCVIRDITAVCGFAQMDFIADIQILCGRPASTVNICPSNIMTGFYEI